MTDQDPEGTEGAEGQGADTEGQHIASMASFDERLGRIEDAIGKITGGAHKDATATTAARLDAGSSIAAEVQAELGRRDQAAKDAERETELEKLKTTVAELAEKPPAEPVRRIERLMGWR